MSQSEYARHLNVSRQAVSEAVRLGRITLVGGKCDPERNDAEWGRMPAAPVAAVPAGAMPTYAESRAAKAAYDAALARLELSARKGELVECRAVESAWHEMIATAKGRLLLISDELGDKLASESNPIRCRELIREKVYHALEALATEAA